MKRLNKATAQRWKETTAIVCRQYTIRFLGFIIKNDLTYLPTRFYIYYRLTVNGVATEGRSLLQRACSTGLLITGASRRTPVGDFVVRPVTEEDLVVVRSRILSELKTMLNGDG
ncbi:MAG: hypothetical protein R3268_02350 [Acidiferrobacterales bacterium]|nr:hypothetical protein [Acidiferrobacterales bacterium]